MARSDALVTLTDGEPVADYLARVGRALPVGAPLAIRLVVGFSLGTGETSLGASLWADLGHDRESWQRVTGTVYADTYADAARHFIALLDARHVSVDQ